MDQGAAFTGTAGNDSFVADNTVDTVLSAADVLNGGDGTDALNVYSAGTAFNVPQLTSIETVNIYDQNADQSLATTNAASVTTVNLIRGDGDVALTVGAGVANVGLKSIALKDAGANNGVTVNANAEATAIALNLDGVSIDATANDEQITVVGTKLTSVTINTSGTKSAAEAINAAAATTININAAVDLTSPVSTTGTAATLNISGAGKVDLGALDADIDVIVATANTGGVTAAIGTSVDTVITGSAGNDVITASSTDAIADADKLAVNAGAGTGDVLVIGDANDINTAKDGARYTNFETLRVSTTQDVSLIDGITALEIGANTAQSFTKLSAAAAGNITVSANNTTSSTFTLKTATGTSDAIAFNLKSATATTNVDLIGVSVVDIENVTINATTGTDGTYSDFGFLADSGDNVKSITIKGSADVQLNQVANTFDTVAVAIDASGLTGTGNLKLAGGVLFAGSSVTGSDNADVILVSTTRGTTYNGGKGNDEFTAAVADLAASGVANADNKINGGDGTDTLVLSDTAATITDNAFTYLSNLEKLTTSTGATSITTGTGFNAAFATGATITSGTIAATKTYTLNAGLYDKALTLTVDATSLTGASTEDITITTGSGNDTVTVTGDDSWDGASGADGATISISTGVGNDTVSVTIDTLTTQTTSQAIVITGGAGVDSITKVGTNGTKTTAVAHFVVADGDSTTTAYDSITGFDSSDGTLLSDGLLFDGTAAVGTLATSTDFGAVRSHSITTGVALFDDAAAYTEALKISATNLADVVGYLAANTATDDTVAFAFDKNGDGTNDSTMVYHNGPTDALVLLDGLTGVDALVTTNTAGANDLFIA